MAIVVMFGLTAGRNGMIDPSAMRNPGLDRAVDLDERFPAAAAEHRGDVVDVDAGPGRRPAGVEGLGAHDLPAVALQEVRRAFQQRRGLHVRGGRLVDDREGRPVAGSITSRTAPGPPRVGWASGWDHPTSK